MTTLMLRAVPHTYDTILIVPAARPALLARWTADARGRLRCRWHIP